MTGASDRHCTAPQSGNSSSLVSDAPGRTAQPARGGSSASTRCFRSRGPAPPRRRAIPWAMVSLAKNRSKSSTLDDSSGCPGESSFTAAARRRLCRKCRSQRALGKRSPIGFCGDDGSNRRGLRQPTTPGPRCPACHSTAQNGPNGTERPWSVRKKPIAVRYLR
jgi:hypothetical protein